MNLQTVHLKDHFPFLGQEGRDPMLTAYIQDPYPYAEETPIKRPGILLCPGGGYQLVSTLEGEPVAMRLLAMGYNVFVLRYAVVPHRFPAQLWDVAAALELIHANTDQWNTDAEKIAIMGFSAGGHLAAHYSNCYDCDEVRQAFPESKPVQATILCYPVITANEKDRNKWTFVNLTGCRELDQETIEKFSCEKMVTSKTPPAFIWHTAEDPGVPVNNSLLYAQALAQHQIPFSLHIYPYGAHGLSTVDEQTNDYVEPNSKMAKNWVLELQPWLRTMFA